MYIPSTFFSTNGGYIVSSGGTQGVFSSGSQLYGYNLFTTPGTASFTVSSGSVGNARLIIIGGGGGGGFGDDGTTTDRSAGGGGAGGIVTYNNIPISVGTYNIVVGSGGAEGINNFYTGSNGTSSSFQYPYPYTPFTSSLLSAFGGGGGNATITGRAVGFGGASGGGSAMFSGSAIPTSSNAVGFGLRNINFENQGFGGGGIPASSAGSSYYNSATGGGGSSTPSADMTLTLRNNGVYVTPGGTGSLLEIYPINGNTSSYFAGGGGAFGPGGSGAGGGPNKLSQGGLGYDNYGGGGNAGGSWSGGGRNTEAGRNGLVYIEYPLFVPTLPNTMISGGLSLWSSYSSLTGSLWYDISGNQNTGIITGSSITVSNNLVPFNGTNNSVIFPIALNATPSSSMTMIWYGVFPSSSQNYDLFCREVYTDGWDTIYSYKDNKLVFRDVLNQDANFSASQFTNKTFYAITVENNSQQAFVNGLKVDTESKAFNGFQVAYDPLVFGFNQNTDANYFSGSISDLLLYNRILTDNEILSIYNYLSQNIERPSYTAGTTTTTTTKGAFPVSDLSLWVDDTSLYGNLWYDISGKGNNGFVSGSTLVMSGSLGYAFNGTDNYVTFPTNLVGQPSSSWTLQYYGTLPSESTNRDMWCKEVVTNGWDTIYRGEDQRDFVLRVRTGSDAISPQISSSLAQKVLITIAISNLAPFASNVTLYRNGSLIGSFTNAGAVNENFNSVSVPFVFGYNADSAATYWKGAVSDILLYSKELSATEVSASYFYLSNN